MEGVNLGFNPENVLYARLAFPKGQYDTVEQKRLFFDKVLQRVAALPGVISASETISLPPFGGPETEVTVPGQAHTGRWQSELELVSEGYFRTLGQRLLQGRLLSEADIDSTRKVAVINQTLARNFFGQDGPLGRTIKFNMLDGLADAPRDAYFEIVGVVADAKNAGLQAPTVPQAYIPYTVMGLGNRVLLVKTALDPIMALRHE